MSLPSSSSPLSSPLSSSRLLRESEEERVVPSVASPTLADIAARPQCQLLCGEEAALHAHRMAPLQRRGRLLGVTVGVTRPGPMVMTRAVPSPVVMGHHVPLPPTVLTSAWALPSSPAGVRHRRLSCYCISVFDDVNVVGSSAKKTEALSAVQELLMSEVRDAASLAECQLAAAVMITSEA